MRGRSTDYGFQGRKPGTPGFFLFVFLRSSLFPIPYRGHSATTSRRVSASWKTCRQGIKRSGLISPLAADKFLLAFSISFRHIQSKPFNRTLGEHMIDLGIFYLALERQRSRHLCRGVLCVEGGSLFWADKNTDSGLGRWRVKRHKMFPRVSSNVSPVLHCHGLVTAAHQWSSPQTPSLTPWGRQSRDRPDP